MAGKGNKKRNSKDSTASKEKKKNGKKKKTGRKTAGSSSAKSNKIQGDIFSEGAMENAYLICHNVQDVLKVRGFPWPEAKKKKKGKRK